DDTKRGFTMAISEQPQTRIENYGSRAVSDTELLALMIQGGGTGPETAFNLAATLLAEAGSTNALLAWTAADYRRIKGIGHRRALQLEAVAEIARRMMTAHAEAPILNRPESIAEHFAPIVAGLQVEKFWVLCLNRKNRLLK